MVTPKAVSDAYAVKPVPETVHISFVEWVVADVETTCSEEKTVREKFVALVAAVSVSTPP